MADVKTLSPEILLHITQSLNLPLHSLTAVIGLLNEGGTVPFIARYRKEATGNLDEVQIRDIEEKLEYFRELVSRRETILASILEQGKLSDELKARIEATLDKSDLEDLYLPYRPKRRTKATIARDRGLQPLADYLWAQQPGEQPVADYATTFIDPEKEVASAEDALEGARHIVAETISEDAGLRKALRQLMFDEGMIVSRKTLDAVDEQEKFRMYYDYREPVKTIPSPHARRTPRRDGVSPLLPDRNGAASHQLPAPCAYPSRHRGLDASSRAGHGRFVEAPAECLDSGRGPSGTQEALRRRCHSGFSR
jgi:uncharacterized protein